MNRQIAFLLAASSIVIISHARAQQTRPALQPLVIADFEQPESISLWAGLKCERTDSHASSGKHAMRVVFPKWKKGMNEWPAVLLAFADGKGYATKDWSPYGKIAFDVSVEGDKGIAMSLELRERQGHNGPATSLTIEPGKINRIEFPLADVTKGIDLKNVEEIVLFSTKPSQDCAVTIDNVRLLPGDRSPFAEFDLIYPNYRGFIFPRAGDPEVEITLNPEERGLTLDQLTVKLFFQTDKRPFVVEYPVKQRRERFSMTTKPQPYGKGTFSAAIYRKADGVNLAGREWPVDKLTGLRARTIRIYIDRNNNTIVEGKPFFPLGWYDRPDEQHLAEIADSSFNCILAYGTNKKPKAWMLSYLDAMEKAGLKLIYCLNDVYPTATYFEGKTWEGIRGNTAIVNSVVAAYRDHPAILAWYLNDELPRALAPQLESYYERVRMNDPNHPCYIVLCNMADLKYFTNTTDVLGVDPYPIPNGPVTTVSEWMDAAMRAVSGHKPVWLVPQAFAWYQYRPAGSDRGRKPTEAELTSGRAPTYEESRCMTYLALTHGAKGLIYYCYYDMRVLPQYDEMWAGMKKIGTEVKQLSPLLLSPDDLGSVAFSPADAPIHTKLKRFNNRLYLLAVNSGSAPVEITFDLRQPLHPKINEVFEHRTLPTDGTKLRAAFKPLEARVFDLGKAPD